MKRFYLLLLLPILAGCIHRLPGMAFNGTKRILIVQSTHPGLTDLQSEPYSISFKQKQDGTKLLLDFLRQAEDKGASYVTNLSVILVSTGTVGQVACTTFIHPVDKTESTMKTVYTPAQYQPKYVYKPVSKMVTEQEYQCKSVIKSVQERETTYTTEYDYYSKTNRSVPKSRYVTRSKSELECGYRPVTRWVSRYEYQYESEYIPPKYEPVRSIYRFWDLEESSPICTDAAENSTNTISGMLFFGKK